jgi:hypothetical protein
MLFDRGQITFDGLIVRIRESFLCGDRPAELTPKRGWRSTRFVD